MPSLHILTYVTQSLESSPAANSSSSQNRPQVVYSTARQHRLLTLIFNSLFLMVFVADSASQPNPLQPNQSASQSIRETAQAIARKMSQDCVARRLRQANRTITRLYDEALRSHGITVNQLNILAVIISEKQIQPSQLGKALGMEKSTVSRTIDRMIKKNWIAARAGEDSRTQILTVTPKGRQLLLSVTPIWNNLQAGVLADASSGNNILQMLAPEQGAHTQIDKDQIDSDSERDEARDYASEPTAEEPISADDFYL